MRRNEKRNSKVLIGEGHGKEVARLRITNMVILFWEYGKIGLWEGRSLKGKTQWSQTEIDFKDSREVAEEPH